MYIGIDHGTTAMRFSNGVTDWKLPRREATGFRISALSHLGPLEEIEGIALTYSMGDNFSVIRPISRLEKRGLISQDGAGEHTGGGTRVFDEVLASDLPALALPGLHRGSPTDPRFHVYSHQASPEKIGIAYLAARDLGRDLVVADVSSNTVSLLVSAGKITGAIDACIFAPGTEHGALDVNALRLVDKGEITANRAFQKAGVRHTLPPGQRTPAIALFTAMECAALLVLNPAARVALAGSCAPVIAGEVAALLGREVTVYDEWCAARGLSLIARDVFSGSRSILGIAVDLS